MSARSITVGPSPFRSRPTTPVFPTPVVTSNPASCSRSAATFAVLSSSIESSGCRCTSLSSSSRSSSMALTPLKLDSLCPLLIAPPSSGLPTSRWATRFTYRPTGLKRIFRRRPGRPGRVLLERHSTGLPVGENRSDYTPSPLSLVAADGEGARPAEHVEEHVGVGRKPLSGDFRLELERFVRGPGQAQHDLLGPVDSDLELGSVAEAQ